MLPNNALFKRILFVLAIPFLSQWASTVESQSRVDQRLTSPYTMPAASYLDLLKNKTGTERQSLKIMAAGRLIHEGRWREGLQLLSSTESLPPELLNEKILLTAKVDLIRQQPKLAIAKLASIRQVDSMPLYYQVQYHEMLATSYRATKNIVDALNERVKLDRLLPDESALSNNRRALWLMLTTLPPEELNSFAVEAAEGSELDGWLQLAVISRKSPEDVQKTLASLERWKAHYPNHSGNTLLPSPLAQIVPYLFAEPRKIALLLPVSGKLAGPGNAVRDGFMQAYDSARASGNLAIQLYDTDTASAAELYQQAVADGADYIVGPLAKADVATVASMSHPVPTVLLNDVYERVKPNAYQFGLSPVNEARQVAVRARKNGHTRALVISPASPWGDEIVTAFMNQWRANGGEVVDTLKYGETQDIAPAVKNLLHAVDLKRPSRNHRSSAELKAQAAPHRRQDFDMIFLLAYPSKARQIMPMLRYYFAGDVPVYATSAVYSGSANAQKDRDLEGVLFCDMPWVFNHQMGYKNWPEQWNSYNRLYALGMDSYALVTQLNQLLLFPAMGASDRSGVLYLSSNQQIARILSWAQIKQGLAEEISG
jgi:outer membrane PBP1 activator LpoA protein